MAHPDIIDRLRQAVDEHDLDALAACFTPDYRNETPAHPDRGFEGRAAVRANWERIFAGVPDITATIHRAATDGNVVWTEWEMTGTRHDGVPQLLRGPIIFGIDDDHIAWGRFYLEPVDAGDDDVDAAISRIVGDGA